jgi:hypothetical protein
VLQRFADTPQVTEGIAEVERVLDDNPGLKVAVGPGDGAASFDTSALRVIPVFRGNPLPIDFISWSALEATGFRDEAVRRAITECRVDLWLLPARAPFVMISHLDGKNLYSAEMLADFRATYEKRASGQLFDQWVCKRDDDASSKRG